MPIRLNSTGGGAVTITAPYTASTYTLTAPGETGNLITTGTTSRIIPTAAMPAGSIVQVVTGTTNTPVSGSGNTFVDTTLNASITPTSATSKIYVMVSQQCAYATSSSPYTGGGIRLLRGSTVILTPINDGSGPFDTWHRIDGGTYAGTWIRSCINYVDSPATTSSTTYKTQIAGYYTGYNYYCQTGTATPATYSTSTITLMEIAV